MLQHFQTLALNPSINTLCLSIALFILVSLILASPNTENQAIKKFLAFTLAACAVQVAQILFLLNIISSPVLLVTYSLIPLSVIFVTWQLLQLSTQKNTLTHWCLYCTIIILTADLLLLAPEIAAALPNTIPESIKQTLSFLSQDNQRFFLIGKLLGLLAVILLSEQVFRNAAKESRIPTNPFFYAIWLWLGSDLYRICYIILINQPEPHLTVTIGYYYMGLAILMLVGSSRGSHQQTFLMSRRSAFYATSLTLSSVALILMSLASYLISSTEVSWLASLQILFVLSMLACTLFLIINPKARSNVHVILNKSFFGSKYDYREIWLKLINRLSPNEQSDKLHQTSLNCIVEIFDADGAALWLKNNDKEFSLTHCLDITIPKSAQQIDSNADFIHPMLKEDWIYNLQANTKSKSNTHNSLIPESFLQINDIWMIGPLVMEKEIAGFYLLCKKKSRASIMWEDLDIARAAGKQIASYIMLQKSAEQLVESKQFDTYNQLTAFIMHDLKNLIAQQALVVKNASKHKDNPAFIEDMIHTISNSVQRMNGLLTKLKRNEDSNNQKTANLKSLLLDTIRKATDRQPIPTLRNQTVSLSILADIDQLSMVLTHLIRNAQDATPNNGFIDIDVKEISNNEVIVSIEDNGCGMSQEFIKHRLFKPFESTKSSMGMGIGAFQAREFIKKMGGNISVESEENIGTKISIQLPLA